MAQCYPSDLYLDKPPTRYGVVYLAYLADYLPGHFCQSAHKNCHESLDSKAQR